MTLRYRKKLILAKLEASSGAAEVLAKADAIQASSIEITPLAGDTVSREIEYAYYGNSGDIPVNSHQTLTFKVELAGSGAKATAPAWGKLLQGCGMAEVITANTSVDYAPVSSGEKSLTIGVNIDGQLHTMSGARGSYSIELGANTIPYLTFTFTGLFTLPASVAAVADPVYTDFKLPLVGSNSNTPTFEFYGKSDLALTTFNYDQANEVLHREVIGATSEVLITNRAPTGSVTIDAPKLSALNMIQKAKEATSGALKLTHGVAEGTVVELNAPAVRAAAPSYQDASGIMQLQMSLAFIPDDGNDEIKITTR